jgi:protein-tyrosine-phosphatase
MPNMKRVLFIDVRNATRSQIAEALFNYFADGSAQARSCGTMPALRVSRRAAQTMAELDIDISRHYPKAVTQFMLEQADVVVLIGRGIYPRAFVPTLVWDFEDATGKSLDEIRELRNQICRRVLNLLDEIHRTSSETIALQLPQQRLTEYLLPV